MSGFKWEPIARVYDPLKAGSIDSTDKVPHDHGIVRAMEVEYKPNKLVTGDPKATIFIGRLDHKTSESTLKETFSKCGEIKRLKLVRDIVTGFSKGYAFIEYHDKYDAYNAQREFNKITLDNKEILVDGECERLLPGWVPRRLGGGFGGKKESGQLRFGGKDRPFKKPFLMHKKDQARDHRRDDHDQVNMRDNCDRYSNYAHSRYSRRDNYERHFKREEYDRHSRREDYSKHSRRNNYDDRYSKQDDHGRHFKRDDYSKKDNEESYSDD